MSYRMLGIWNYSLKAASERFSHWMYNALGAAVWFVPDDQFLPSQLYMQLLSAKTADPQDVYAEKPMMLNDSKARLQLTQGHLSPFFSHFSHLLNHRWKGCCHFQWSSSPFLLSLCLQYVYAACLSLIYSFVTMMWLTITEYPCAQEWLKEELSFAP